MSMSEDRGAVLKPASIHTCRANAALGARAYPHFCGRGD